MQIRSIVVWTDGSIAGDSAVDRAAQSAARLGAAFTVALAPLMGDKQQRRLRPRVARRVRQLGRQHGVALGAVQAAPASWAEAWTMAATADLLVLPAPWRAGCSRLWQPGLVDRALRHADCALLVVRQPASVAWGRAVAAVDLGARSPALLAVAGRLGGDLPFELLHVLPGLPRRGLGLRAAPLGLRGPVSAHQLHAESELAQLAARSSSWGLAAARPMLASGDTASAIFVHQQQAQARLAVLGHARRSSLLAALFGSVASTVAHRAACDVLVVPDAWLDRWAGLGAVRREEKEKKEEGGFTSLRPNGDWASTG